MHPVHWTRNSLMFWRLVADMDEANCYKRAPVDTPVRLLVVDLDASHLTPCRTLPRRKASTSVPPWTPPVRYGSVVSNTWTW